MRPRIHAILVLICALSGTTAHAQIDTLVAQCEGCHGPQGVSAHSDVPTIAGQSAKFLEKTLRTYQVWGRPCIKSAYRHGDTTRPKTDMCQVAEGLTGENSKAISAHFAAQPFQAATQEFDADLATRGKALHEDRCEQCHEQGGSVADRGPRLAGQWLPYLRTSLKYVPTGEHLVPPPMESVVAGLDQQEIEAILNYYASQQD
jgi:sulfide dehydrogenase cytochrome subunit